MENSLNLGKLLSLWFCFLLHSILFLISQTSYRTYKIISSYELARSIMGTIFLVGERAKRARHSQVCSIENRGYIYYWRASEASETLSGLFNRESRIYTLLASERDTLRSVQLRIVYILG